MDLIIGAELDPDEYEAARQGYSERERLNETLARAFSPVFRYVDDSVFLKRLEALQWLIAHNRLDIKVAIRRKGMFHEKVGYMEDAFGDFVVFQGSANESLHALDPDFNYESVNVFKSWRMGDEEHYLEHIQSFNDLWDDEKSKQSKNTLVVPLPVILKDEILRRKIPSKVMSTPEVDLFDQYRSKLESQQESIAHGPRLPQSLRLFPHQRRALTEWKEANYRGILNLATGTGKTITAIAGATRLYQHLHQLFMVVTVPYASLQEQWLDELKKFGVRALACSSSNPGWKKEFFDATHQFLTGRSKFAAAVFVNGSLASEDVARLLKRIPGEFFIFIGDECHNLGTDRLSRCLPENAAFRVGLSATFERKGDERGTQLIQDYFGTPVGNYGLADAIDEGFLTPYEYFLEQVELTEGERGIYLEISRRISERLARLGKSDAEGVSDPILQQLLFERARFLGKLTNKKVRLKEILEARKLNGPTLIYCGAGALNLDDEEEAKALDEEVREIDYVTSIVNGLNLRVSKYTSAESLQDRAAIMENFRSGSIQVLTAIRCLDEGVDVPACENAFILASTRNPRQFIQRRGRVLRRSRGKTVARIWDFIPVLPVLDQGSEAEKKLVRREMDRVREFATHARNYVELMPVLDELDNAALASPSRETL